ncbi:MAG: DUF86 domain-containing protein [Dehalococcoidia bacterium]|nr:DUF86 domain-containing protein [Dehalococcoidia bacterium]
MTDEELLSWMVESLSLIEEYVAPGRGHFIDSTITQDAVIRRLEIVGEAAKRLSHDVRRRFDDVPWRAISGLRDVLAHDFAGVRLSAIWAVATEDAPQLRQQVLTIQSTLPEKRGVTVFALAGEVILAVLYRIRYGREPSRPSFANTLFGFALVGVAVLALLLFLSLPALAAAGVTAAAYAILLVTAYLLIPPPA